MSLTPFDEVRDRILGMCRPTEVVDASLGSARGRVVADDVVSATPVRPFASSAMDGYAVRSDDTPGRLRVIGEARAGHAGPPVGAGEAVAISTGAPVPGGADAVVRLEDAEPEDGEVAAGPTSAGADIRPSGDDLAVGSLVAASGTRLSAAHLGVLASLGLATVGVHRAPRIGVLSTGDELLGSSRSDEFASPSGHIHDANRPVLMARARDHGAEPTDLGVVGDDPQELARTLRYGAACCDLVVVSGGASVGPHDHLAEVAGDIGTSESLRLAVKPAKPFVLGVVDDVPVLGLPGNPVAAFVAFELLVRPAILAIAGHPDPVAPLVPAIAGQALERSPDGRVHVVPVRFEWLEDGRRTATPTGPRGSHRITGLSGADGLALVPDGDGIGAGQRVEVLPL